MLIRKTISVLAGCMDEFSVDIGSYDYIATFMSKLVKPRSHSGGMAPVHPGGGQPVYRDKPGHFS